MTVLRALGILARVLIGAGVLLVLFTAYQIWGTTWAQSRTQSSLRSQLHHELPSALRHDSPPTPVVQAGPPKVAPPAKPPPNGQPVGILRIPSLGVNQVVVQGVSESDLSKGPGHYPGTPLPGQAGNAAIAGHRTTWGHPFYNLNAMKMGAPVYLTTAQGVFTYTAKSLSIVSPGDTTVLAATTEPSLTLTTCNPLYSASQRLILRAVLSASRPLGGGTRAQPAAVEPTHNAELAGSTSGSWLSVALWGAGLAALAVVLWALAQRTKHRWLTYLAGAPVVLVLLYFFFAAVTPHLPATF